MSRTGSSSRRTLARKSNGRDGQAEPARGFQVERQMNLLPRLRPAGPAAGVPRSILPTSLAACAPCASLRPHGRRAPWLRRPPIRASPERGTPARPRGRLRESRAHRRWARGAHPGFTSCKGPRKLRGCSPGETTAQAGALAGPYRFSSATKSVKRHRRRIRTRRGAGRAPGSRGFRVAWEPGRVRPGVR